MLKKNANDEKSKALQNMFDKYGSDLLLTYSPAHIQDLLKGSDSLNNLPLIEDDLNFIDELTKGKNLQFDFKHNRTNPNIGSAHQLFKGYKSTDLMDIFNPKKIKKELDELGIPVLGSIIDIMFQRKIDINFDNFSSNPDLIGFDFKSYFKRSMQSNTIYNILLDFSDFNKDLNNNPKIYKELVRVFRDQLGFDPNIITNSTNPIDSINKVLESSAIKSNFDKISSIENSENNDINNSFFTKYSMEYANLDLTGYYPDKLNNKNQYSNFTNDIHHSFFGGHCDYFITNETNLIEKSNLLYSKYKSLCVALKPSEFITKIEKMLQYDLSVDGLFNSLNYTFENNYIDEIINYRTENSKLFLFKPESRILGYFNYAYISERKNCGQLFFLRNISKNFSNFCFYEELYSITNKLVSIFGLDIYGNGELNDDDISNIEKEVWKGRNWIVSKYFCNLSYDKREIQLELSFEEITEDLINQIKGTDTTTY